MSNAIVDWGGVKPYIPYDPKDNSVKVSIGSLGGWVRKKITSSSEEEDDDKEGDKTSEALEKIVHSGGQRTIMDSRSGSLGPSFYHWDDNGEYTQWLREYLESEYDMMVTSHHACLSDEILSLKREEYSLLEPCEVLTENEWLRRGLRP
jgi:hypothetical protein